MSILATISYAQFTGRGLDVKLRSLNKQKTIQPKRVDCLLDFD